MRALCGSSEWKRRRRPPDNSRAGAQDDSNAGRKRARRGRRDAILVDWLASDPKSDTAGSLASARRAASGRCKSSASTAGKGAGGEDEFRWPLLGCAPKRCLLLLALLVAIHLIGQHRAQRLAVEAHTLVDFDGATFYKAPVGARVRIACNGSHWSDESVSLVLWFKGTVERHSVPIYTVDARQRPLSNGARHFVADAYKGRARFVSKASPPYLDLAPLEPDDQSEYRCRVDYRAKPRENFLIILFVLVPPKSVQIVDSNGRSLERIYGPLSEGSDLTLLCLSKGGRPAPSVIWKRRTKVIDDSYLTLNDFLALEQAGQLLSGDSASANRAPTPPSGGRLRLRQSQAGLASSDNNQQQLNSINADPSLDQLAALWQEWRDWPEFDFYSSRLRHSNSSWAGGNWSSRAGVSSPASSALETAAATGQQPLLALSVDESVTTSVNVLKLSNLGASEQAQPSGTDSLDSLEWPPDSARALASPAASQSTLSAPGRPLLVECQASNLHYDLRSLIKLFAPPSLAGRAAVGAGTGVDPSSAPSASPSRRGGSTWSGQLGPSERQLVEASDKALEATLRLAAPDWTATHGDQPGSAAAANGELESPQQQVGAAALKQIKPELATTVAANGTDGFQGAQELFTGHKQQQSVAGLVLQQLSRPHQLAAAASAAAGGARQEEAPGQQEEGPQHQAGGGGSLMLSRLIALDVLLRPLDVRISTPPRPLSAGQTAEFSCTSAGSRPPAKLSWFKDGRPLDSKLSRQVDEPNGNASHSKLSVQLEQQDHGAQLACRAQNEQLTRLQQQQSRPASPSDLPAAGEVAAPGSSSALLEDSRTLTVHYAPKVILELGNKILSSAIREGSDIYFVCRVDAVPPIREITWLHNERPVNETSLEETHDGDDSQTPTRTAGAMAPSSKREGLIISNNSLVLQRVKVGQRGHYACVASNSEGISESNRIELRVLHTQPLVPNSTETNLTAPPNTAPPPTPDAPVCVGAATGLQRKAAVGGDESAGAGRSSAALLVASRRIALHSSAQLLCRMEADPPELEVSWYLNNSHSERRLLFSGRTQAAMRPERPQQDLGQQSDVLDGGGSPLSSSSAPRAATTLPTSTTPTQVAAAARMVARTQAQSQLNYLVESGLDYGRLYCVARNSIGEQQRACVYEIQQPGPDEAPALGCLAVNVTSSSVWIGCEPVHFDGQLSRGSSQDSASRQHRFSIQVYSGSLAASNSSSSLIVDEQQRQLQAAASEWAPAAGSSEETHSWSSSATNNFGQLEANLTSDSLEEPLFSVNKLRPQTSYTVHVRALDPFSARSSQPAMVRFATSRDERSLQQPAPSGESNAEDSSSSALATRTGAGKPTIVVEPIEANANQHRLLLSALISTRSTGAAGGSQQQDGGGGTSDYSSSSAGFGASGNSSSRWQLVAHQRSHQQQQVPSSSSADRAQTGSTGRIAGGLLSRVWSALGSFGSSLASPFSSRPTATNSAPETSSPQSSFQASRLQQSARARPSTSQSKGSAGGSQQLMDISGAVLVVGLCLLLAGSLVVLLFLHRYSSSRKLGGRANDEMTSVGNSSRAKGKKSRARNGGHSPGDTGDGGGGGDGGHYSAEATESAKRQPELIGGGDEMMLQSIGGDGDDEAGSPSDRSRERRSSLAETCATNQSNFGQIMSEPTVAAAERTTWQSCSADRCATLGHLGGANSFGPAAFRAQAGSAGRTLEHARFSSARRELRQQQRRLDSGAPAAASHVTAGSLIQLASSANHRCQALEQQEAFATNCRQQQQQCWQSSALQLYGSTAATGGGSPTTTAAAAGLVSAAGPIRVSKSRSSLCSADAPLMGAQQPQLEAAAAHLHARQPQQSKPHAEQQQRLIQLSDIDRRLISDANLLPAGFNDGWRPDEGGSRANSSRQQRQCSEPFGPGWQAYATSSSTTGASLASTDSESRTGACNIAGQEYDQQRQLEQQHGVSHFDLGLDSLDHFAQAVARQSHLQQSHEARRPPSSLCAANDCQHQDYESSALIATGNLMIGDGSQAFVGQVETGGCANGNSAMGNHQAAASSTGASHRINGNRCNHERQQQQLTTSCSLVSESSPETLASSRRQQKQLLSAAISSSAGDNSAGQLLGFLLGSAQDSTSGSTTQASLESSTCAVHGNSNNMPMQSKIQQRACNGKTKRKDTIRYQHLRHRQILAPNDESSQQIFQLAERQELLAGEQFHHHRHHLCSNSLISDESASDSNAAHCTWPTANGDNDDAARPDNLGGQLRFETNDQVNFIRLLPTNCTNISDQAETGGQEGGQQLNLSINNKVPTRPIANKFGHQQCQPINGNELVAGQPKVHLCPSLTSSSIGSSPTKDLLLGSTPLSVANTESQINISAANAAGYLSGGDGGSPSEQVCLRFVEHQKDSGDHKAQ